MKERYFADIEKMKTKQFKELSALPKVAFQSTSKIGNIYWHKCIIFDGGYFKEDNTDIDEQIKIF